MPRWKADKVFFFHNAKAGGTSIIQSITGCYAPEQVCPNIENNSEDHERLSGSYRAFIGHKLYAGHYGRDVFDAVSDGHLPITNFRLSSSRLVSLYNFFRYSVEPDSNAIEQPHFYAVKAAKTMSFEDFVFSEHPSILLYTSNYHARQLSWSPYESYLAPLGEIIDFIGSMLWFFVCEEVAKSAAWAAESLGWNGGAFSHENTRSPLADPELHVSNLTAKVLGRIRSLNEADDAIHAYACYHLAQRSK